MREWMYYIIDTATGASYQIDNGMVVAIGNYKPLSQTPIGWQDITLVWERSAEKFGLTRGFSLPLGFVIEGQSILTYLNWKNNFEQQVSLLINRKKLFIDTSEYYFWHKFFYKGELDFSTYNYDDETAKATVNLMEGGLSKKLNADWDTVYEIHMTDPKYIKADGINLHKSVTYSIPGPTEDAPDGITVSNTVLSEFALPTSTIATDVSAAGVFLQDQFFDPVPNHFTYLSTSTNHLVKIEDDFTSPVTLNIVGTIKVTCLVELPTGAQLQLRLLNQDGVGFEGVGTPSGTGLPHTPSGNFTEGITYSFDFDMTGVMQPGDRIFFIGFLFTTVTGAIEIKIQFATGTKFKVNLATTHATSYPPALDLITLYKRIGAKISGNEDDWTSGLLTLRPDILVASGDAIRGISRAVIKTSMHQFFNSVDVILNAGIGVENFKCILEAKEHFFQTDNPISLGEVKKYKDKWATDYIFNTLKIGYPDVNLENVNGRSAFNTSYLYSSPIKKVVKELRLVSDYRADPFEIELNRISGATTKDTIQDNNNYFIQVSTATEVNLGGLTVYPLYRPAWTITGVPDPATVFNIGLSVRRLVDVHANWLAGVFAGFDTKELKFESTQYNREVVANGLDEDAPISISGLGTPLFKPVNFDFQSPFLNLGEQGMNRLVVYDDNTTWAVSGDGDPDDTSGPNTGTKAIKIVSTLNTTTIFTTNESAIPLSALEQLSLYVKISASRVINVSLHKGLTTVATYSQPFFGSGSYRHLLINRANFTILDPSIKDFDSIRVGILGLGSATSFIDSVELFIDPQIDLTSIMDVNPNRCFSFIHPNGKLLKGHSIKVGAAPNTEQEQGFLLLATGDTNLEDLII